MTIDRARRPDRLSRRLRRQRLERAQFSGPVEIDGLSFTGLGYVPIDTDHYEAVLFEDGRRVGPSTDELIGPGLLVDLDRQYDDDDDGYVSDPDWWYRGAPFTGLSADFDPDVGWLRRATRLDHGVPVEEFSFLRSGVVSHYSCYERLRPARGGVTIIRQSMSWQADGSLQSAETWFWMEDGTIPAPALTVELSADGRLRKLSIRPGYFDQLAAHRRRLSLWAPEDLDFLTPLGADTALILSLGGDRGVEVVDRLAARRGLEPVRELAVRLHVPSSEAALERLLDLAPPSLEAVDLRTNPVGSVRWLRRLEDLRRHRPELRVTFQGIQLLPSSQLAAHSDAWTPFALYYDDRSGDLVGAVGLRSWHDYIPLVDRVVGAPSLVFVAERAAGAGRGQIIARVRDGRPDVHLLEIGGRAWVEAAKHLLDHTSDRREPDQPAG